MESDIKSKIAKLINLSNNEGASQGEIDNAIRMANTLLERHNLTRDDIDMDSNNPTKNVTFNRFESWTLQSNKCHWELSLCNFVCDFIECVNFFQQTKQLKRIGGFVQLNDKGESIKATKITFYGSEDECEIAKELFDELQSVISTMAKLKYGNFRSGEGASYAQGFVDGLKDAHQKVILELANADKATNELMIISQERTLALVDGASDWLQKEHGIRLRTTTVRRKYTKVCPKARRSGMSDGGNYEVGKRSATKKLT